MDDKPTYSKHVIDIADYMYKYPDKQPAEIMREFAGVYGKSERTVERYLKQAREYNISRLQRQEKAKDKVLTADAVESIKKGILTRNEALAILSSIAKGNARKVEGQMLIPSDGERTRAITTLSDMQRWNEMQEVKKNNEIIIRFVDDGICDTSGV